MVSFLQQDMNTAEDFKVSISSIKNLMNKDPLKNTSVSANSNLNAKNTENLNEQSSNPNVSKGLKNSNSNSNSKAASNFNTGNRLIQ